MRISNNPIGILWARAERASYLNGTRYALRLCQQTGRTAGATEYAANLVRARQAPKLPRVHKAFH